MKRILFVILAVSLCTTRMHAMEYVQETLQSLYNHYVGTESEQSARTNDAVTSLLDFVQTGINDIDTRVSPQEIQQILQQGMLKDIEIMQGEWEEEVDIKLATLCKEARMVVQTYDKQQLEALNKTLFAMRNNVEAHREGLPFLIHRIGNNVETVMGNISGSFKALDEAAKLSGYDVYKAYSILGFDQNNRSQISSEKIRTIYVRLGKQYKGTQTPLGSAVRQAGYLLQSPFGKQNYDAFLTDYLNPHTRHQALRNLVITDSMAKILKIDYAVFNDFITNSKYYLEELNKAVQARAQEIS